MTKKTFLASPLVALATVLVAAPIAAQDGTVVTGRQNVNQEQVSFADLDLRDESARVTLRRRVRSAANMICYRLVPMDGLASLDEIRACANQAYGDARPQVAAVIGRAISGQQMAMSLVVSAPARVR